jgi:MFS family permease
MVMTVADVKIQPVPAVPTEQLFPGLRWVLWNAVLWTAGNALTSGAFLSYFAQDLGASGLWLAVLLAMPEVAAVCGVTTPWWWQWGGSRRTVWLATSLLARGLTFLIPVIGWTHRGPHGVWWLIVLLAIAQAAQGVSTTLYFSWLADLVPRQNWGQYFARRNIYTVLVLMVVPLGGALLRDHWKRSFSPDALWWAYTVVFSAGSLLMLMSMLPLLAVAEPLPGGRPGRRAAIAELEDVTASSQSDQPEVQPPAALPKAATVPAAIPERSWESVQRQRAMTWVLAHSWCLAVANGLTQAAFFKYQYGQLKLGLTGYYLMFSVMLLCQLVWSARAGRCRTPAEHHRMLFWSTLCSAMALPFWLTVDASTWWWLFGAYVCWGAFGAVNVAGPNLMLSWSDQGQAAWPLSLFRQVAGCLAGLSGIAGGWLLDSWLTGWSGSSLSNWMPSAFHALFCLSWLGRVAAALLLLPLQSWSWAVTVEPPQPPGISVHRPVMSSAD